MEEVLQFLNKCGAYYLATVEWDQPRVRPFGTVNIFEWKLYIQTWKSKNVSKQIQANPKVELSGFVDWKWIRVEWELVRDDRIEPKKICWIIIQNWDECMMKMMIIRKFCISKMLWQLSILLQKSQKLSDFNFSF